MPSVESTGGFEKYTDPVTGVEVWFDRQKYDAWMSRIVRLGSPAALDALNNAGWPAQKARVRELWDAWAGACKAANLAPTAIAVFREECLRAFGELVGPPDEWRNPRARLRARYFVKRAVTVNGSVQRHESGEFHRRAAAVLTAVYPGILDPGTGTAYPRLCNMVCRVMVDDRANVTTYGFDGPAGGADADERAAADFTPRGATSLVDTMRRHAASGRWYAAVGENNNAAEYNWFTLGVDRVHNWNSCGASRVSVPLRWFADLVYQVAARLGGEPLERLVMGTLHDVADRNVATAAKYLADEEGGAATVAQLRAITSRWPRTTTTASDLPGGNVAFATLAVGLGVAAGVAAATAPPVGPIVGAVITAVNGLVQFAARVLPVAVGSLVDFDQWGHAYPRFESAVAQPGSDNLRPTEPPPDPPGWTRPVSTTPEGAARQLREVAEVTCARWAALSPDERVALVAATGGLGYVPGGAVAVALAFDAMCRAEAPPPTYGPAALLARMRLEPGSSAVAAPGAPRALLEARERRGGEGLTCEEYRALPPILRTPAVRGARERLGSNRHEGDLAMIRALDAHCGTTRPGASMPTDSARFLGASPLPDVVRDDRLVHAPRIAGAAGAPVTLVVGFHNDGASVWKPDTHFLLVGAQVPGGGAAPAFFPVALPPGETPPGGELPIPVPGAFPASGELVLVFGLARVPAPGAAPVPFAAVGTTTLAVPGAAGTPTTQAECDAAYQRHVDGPAFAAAFAAVGRDPDRLPDEHTAPGWKRRNCRVPVGGGGDAPPAGYAATLANVGGMRESPSGPLLAAAAKTFDAALTIRNTGTRPWMPGDVSLERVAGLAGAPGGSAQPPAGGIAPGAPWTVTLTLEAPAWPSTLGRDEAFVTTADVRLRGGGGVVATFALPIRVKKGGLSTPVLTALGGAVLTLLLAWFNARE